ncbi:MAG: GAF domain-containing SpoIIE family protein phosphatase [bacterium]
MKSNPMGIVTTPPDDEVNRLRESLRELSLLYEINTLVDVNQSQEQILTTIADCLVRAYNVGQCSILFRPVANAVLHPLQVTSGTRQQFSITDDLIRWIEEGRNSILLNHPLIQEFPRKLPWITCPTNFLAAPILHQNTSEGIIALFNLPEESDFSRADTHLLPLVAQQIDQIFEMVRGKREELARIQRAERDRLAQHIQAGMLPKTNLELTEYEIAGSLIPARIIRGDFFDIVHLPNRKVALYLIDVSGESIDAALRIARLQMAFRGQLLHEAEPRDYARRWNDLIIQADLNIGQLSLFFGILDPATGIFTFCNAGHEHPYYFQSDGWPKQLSTGGILLGALEGFPYGQDTVQLNAGDVLLLYSDGVLHATNNNGVEFGEGRLIASVQENRTKPCSELVSSIHEDIQKFYDANSTADDLSLIVIKRKSA